MSVYDFLQQSEFLNISINILTILILIYFIYQFIYNYHKETQFKHNNVTSYKDIDDFINEYSDTRICNNYKNLNEREKEFLYHLANAQRIKYKENNPNISKRFNGLKSQLFINMIITLLLKQKTSAVADSLKHNTLFAFFSTI
jgi:hypothetical protein